MLVEPPGKCPLCPCLRWPWSGGGLFWKIFWIIKSINYDNVQFLDQNRNLFFLIVALANNAIQLD